MSRQKNSMLSRRQILGALPTVPLLSAVTRRMSVQTPRATSGPALAPLCNTAFWKFERVLGEGEGAIEQTSPVPVFRMSSAASAGMAAYLRSGQVPVEPNRQYIVTAEIKSQGFESLTARLTGSPYVQFYDTRLLPGGYQPTRGQLARRDSDWHEISQVVTTPTTARTAEVCLAYGAYGDYEAHHYPRVTGRARGSLWVRNVRIRAAGSVTPLPSSIHVSEPLVQQALDTVAGCLHNASLSGRFTVGDGYTLSDNIVPDLSFGLFGVRRLAHPQYIEIVKQHWRQLAAAFTPEGRAPGRVMTQVFFPLGVDELYGFTGDQALLDEFLPIADRSFAYMERHADEHGLVTLVKHGQWSFGQGADWVDWYPTRMEGKTLNFHQWYARALRRVAALHRTRRHDNSLASTYERRASQVEDSLRRLYWRGNYFVTNTDYDGRVADEKWLDDQVWSIRLGVASPQMAKQIWAWIDAAPQRYEGVPTRWTAFPGPVHGPMSWFGRLGAGDILARYASGRQERGIELVRRISAIFNRDQNVYEAYDMYGDINPGTLGWGNYTEHSGGYVWSVLAGPLGVDLDADPQALGTVAPNLPPEWRDASAEFYVHGTRVQLEVTQANGHAKLKLSGMGQPRVLHLRLPGGKTDMARIGSSSSRTWTYPIEARRECSNG